MAKCLSSSYVRCNSDMLISDGLANELVACTEQNFKPRIAIDNYVLYWGSDSSGIPRSEESNLRAFVRDLAAHISSSLFGASGDFHNGLSNRANPRAVRQIEESLRPRICMSRKTKATTYLAEMDPDGKTTISMTRRLVAPPAKLTGEQARRLPSLQWELGELVFERQPRKS